MSNKKKKGFFKKTRYLFLLILLGLAVHLILPQIASLQKSISTLQQMSIWFVSFAILAEIGSYLGSGYLLNSLVSLSKSKLSVINGTLMTLAGASFGMVAGGMVGSAAIQYHWMENEDIKSEAATLASTFPGFFNESALVFAAVTGLIHLLLVHQLSKVQAISFILILILLFSVAILLLIGLHKRVAMTSFILRITKRWVAISKKEFQPQKITGWLNGVFTAFDMLIKGGWHGPLIGALLNIGFDMLTLYLLFFATGHHVTVGVLLTGYGLPLLLGKMAFIVPGGVGIIESSMIGLYVSLGVPNAIAVVVVLAYRVISFWLPLILGFPLVLYFQRKSEHNKKIEKNPSL